METEKDDPYKNKKWTGVFKVSKEEVNLTRIYSLATDMESLDDMPSYVGKKRRSKWTMIFDPVEFEEANPELKMEEWKLSVAELKKYAIICS